MDKTKKNNKENSRKDSNFKEFKEKNDILKSNEKNLLEEKANLLEKLKQMKVDLNRKEILNRELKEKLDLTTLKNEAKKFCEDENEKNKEIIKKMKIDIERKETTIKNLKIKLDGILLELDQSKTKTLQKKNVNILYIICIK